MANEFVIKNGYISKGNSQLSGSLDVSGSVSASLGANTVGFYGTSSWAVSASWAPGATPTTPGGSNTQIQFNSASAFSGSSNLSFNYTNNNLLLTGSVLLSGSAAITGVNYIDFLTTANPTHQEGRIHWTDDTKTLQVDTDVNNFMIELGHQNVIRVRNENSFTIAKGKIVRLVGESGNRPLIATASWTGDATSAATIGWVAAAIGSNNNGYVITNGILRGIDTSLYTPGTMLYLSSSGDWTSTPPDAPLHEVRLGQVIIQGNSTTGVVYVNIMNGYELTELHDVKTTTYSDGDLLIQSASLWINSKNLTGSYTLSGSLFTTGSNQFNGSQNITGSVNIVNGNVNIKSNSYYFQGTNTSNGNVSLIGVNNQNQIYIGNQGYDNILASDTRIQGNTQITGSVDISGSTYITGSLNVSNGITGSLFGTASWAYSSSQALTASYVNPLSQTVIISGSLNVYDSNLSASISSSARKLYDIGGDPSIDWTNRVLYDDTGTEVRINWSDNAFNGSEALSLYDTSQIKSITWNTRQLFDGAGNQAINYSDLTTSNGVRVYGTSSYALTASYVNGMITKNNYVAGGTFAGNPKKATVTFSTPFPNASYSVTVTGEEARSWTIESKVSGSFVINSNSNTALANNVYWQAITYGEFKQ